MGNCQAIDAATLVIQHPCGKVDKLYRPVSASEVMRINPGHYVALLISSTLYNQSSNTADQKDAKNVPPGPVRLTRIKLLRPADTLVLGQVYRIITTQEVMKGLSAKKHAKVKKSQQESGDEKGAERAEAAGGGARSQLEKENEVKKHGKHRPRAAAATTNAPASRSKTWQPSLHSISEAAS